MLPDCESHVIELLDVLFIPKLSHLIYILDKQCCISAPLISLDYQEVLGKA